MKQQVSLESLNLFLMKNQNYIDALNHVKNTASSLGISSDDLMQILTAYQEVEQIRADFLLNSGFPLKEKHGESDC